MFAITSVTSLHEYFTIRIIKEYLKHMLSNNLLHINTSKQIFTEVLINYAICVKPMLIMCNATSSSKSLPLFWIPLANFVTMD